MGFICESCGSVTIIESGKSYETKTLTERGEYENISVDSDEEWNERCAECDNQDVTYYDEDLLNENDAKSILSLEGDERVLRLFLSCLKNAENKEKEEYKTKITDFLENNVDDEELKKEVQKEIVVYCI